MPPSEYATQADIYRFGFSDKALRDISWENDLQPAVRAASAKFDSALGSGHTLPLTEWGDDVRSAVAVLAAWDVYSVRGLRPGDDAATHPLRLRAVAVDKWIEGVADGKYYPNVTDSSAPAISGGTTADAPWVSSNERRGWAEDPLSSTSTPLPFQGRRGT